MTLNADNLTLFYTTLGIYGVGLAIVARATLSLPHHKVKRRDHLVGHR